MVRKLKWRCRKLLSISENSINALLFVNYLKSLPWYFCLRTTAAFKRLHLTVLNQPVRKLLSWLSCVTWMLSELSGLSSDFSALPFGLPEPLLLILSRCNSSHTEKNSPVRMESGRRWWIDWIISTIRERSRVIKVTTWRLANVSRANVCRKHKAAFVGGMFCRRKRLVQSGQSRNSHLSYISFVFCVERGSLVPLRWLGSVEQSSFVC